MIYQDKNFCIYRAKLIYFLYFYLEIWMVVIRKFESSTYVLFEKPKNYLELCVYSMYILIIYVTFWFCKPAKKVFIFQMRLLIIVHLAHFKGSKKRRWQSSDSKANRASGESRTNYRGFQSFALLVCFEVKRLTIFRPWNLNQLLSFTFFYPDRFCQTSTQKWNALNNLFIKLICN